MNGRNWSIVALLVVLAIVLSACGILVGSGERVTENREVSGFDSVSLTGSGVAIITQGGGESLTIETNENVIEHITSEVRDGTLHLGTDEQGNAVIGRITFTVGVDELKAAAVAGSGRVESESIETDSLDIRVAGSGSVNVGSLSADELSVRIGGSGGVEVAGKVPEQDIRIAGSGRYQAGDLLTETTVITISGSGKATLWTTESLDTDVSGSGSIDYYGNPTVSSSSSGSGDITGLGEK